MRLGWVFKFLLSFLANLSSKYLPTIYILVWDFEYFVVLNAIVRNYMYKFDLYHSFALTRESSPRLQMCFAVCLHHKLWQLLPQLLGYTIHLLGIILILRQHKIGWTFSTVFLLTLWVFGSKKVKSYADAIYGWSHSW